MKNVLLAVALMSVSAFASAQTVASETTQLPDGVVRTPRYESNCNSNDRLSSSIVGGVGGLALAKGGARAMNSSNEDVFAFAGAAIGALVGYQYPDTELCKKVAGEKLIGYDVKVTKNGKTTTTFEAAK